MATNDKYVDYYLLDVSNNEMDTFNPTPNNVANFGAGFGLYMMFVHFYAAEWLSIVLVILLQFMWQCKNALVPYTRYGDTSSVLQAVSTIKEDPRYFGGFGFSYHQEIYGAVGVLMGFLLDLIWPPAIQPSKAEEEANSF